MLTFILTLAVFYITRSIVRSDMTTDTTPDTAAAHFTVDRDTVTYTLTEQDLLDMGDKIYAMLLDYADATGDYDYLNF